MGQSRQTDSQSPSTGSSGAGITRNLRDARSRSPVGGTGRQVRSVDHLSTRRSATSAPTCDVSALRRCRFRCCRNSRRYLSSRGQDVPDLVIALCARGCGDRSFDRNEQHRATPGHHPAKAASPRRVVRSGTCLHLLIAGSSPLALPRCVTRRTRRRSRRKRAPGRLWGVSASATTLTTRTTPTNGDYFRRSAPLHEVTTSAPLSLPEDLVKLKDRALAGRAGLRDGRPRARLWLRVRRGVASHRPP
jgi:hypothetical protein